MPDDLIARFRRRDRNALSRLLSLVARGEGADEILRAVGAPARPARVVALTGAGGVGKSTLAGRLVGEARGRGLTVAVLACDPQSPLTGGALLGDRFRMPARPDDDGVFIRSLAAAGGRGAVAERLDALIRLCEAFGFDVVLVETVGAGQGDTAVRALVDVLVLLLQPETGDDLQWEKAGLLEVADVVAIQKADLPGAERVEAQVLATLALSPAAAPPVVRVSARTGAGVEQLWSAIAALPLRRSGDDAGADLLRLAQDALAARFAAARAAGDENLQQLLGRWRGGELDSGRAAEVLLGLLGGNSQGEAPPARPAARVDGRPRPPYNPIHSPFRPKSGGRVADAIIPLSDILADVAAELLKAQELAKQRGHAAMQFEECEVEFAVRAEAEGKAGVKLYFLNLVGGVKRTETNTIRVKYKGIPGHRLQAGQTVAGKPGPELKKQETPPQ